MCIVSMVYDHYQPLIPQPIQPVPTFPFGTFTTAPPVGQFVILSKEEADRLTALIANFREAVEAAAKVDKLTGQPDCEDPEKRKLEARVEALERQIAEMRKAIAP